MIILDVDKSSDGTRACVTNAVDSAIQLSYNRPKHKLLYD